MYGLVQAVWALFPEFYAYNIEDHLLIKPCRRKLKKVYCIFNKTPIPRDKEPINQKDI